MNPRGWRKLTLNRRLIVNLKSGDAFAGVVVREAAGVLVLADVTLYSDGRSPVELDGEAIIDLDNVAFAQTAAPADPRPAPNPAATEA